MRALALRLDAALDKSAWILWAVGIVGVVNVAYGWHLGHPYVAVGGALGVAFALLGPTRRILQPSLRKPDHRPAPPVHRLPYPPVSRPAADPNDLDAVVAQMIEQGRYTLLLRPQIVQNLDGRHFRQTLHTLEERMALVPDGEVVLGNIDEALNDGKLDEEELRACSARIIGVERFFLDRYPVTNQEFYEFVDAGGYAQVALWDQAIWPAVLDLVDRNGLPGPRFWKNGCYEAHLADHPVVGVSWYEARAYARWVGKRLPTDAEWVKAGSWPVRVSAEARLQRKYPWGQSMDHTRANLWPTHKKGTVSVREFAEGVSVGGAYQLIGNVWEWTRSNYTAIDTDGEELATEGSMKSIRGGAFDTYFDNQATCQFASGEYPMARKPNVGFRCAISVCDLVLARIDQHAASGEPEETPEEMIV